MALVKIPKLETSPIKKRDQLLSETDPLIMLPDYPYKTELAEYRQALRDWPDSDSFPDEMPEAPKTEGGKPIL